MSNVTFCISEIFIIFIFVFSSITLLINITDVNRKTIISPDIKSDIDDHTLSLFLSLNRKLMYLGCTCLLPAFLGVSNIFYAQPTADIYASIVTIICFIKIIPSYLKSHGVQ